MTHADDLRAWAKGVYAIEAGTELLLRAFNGRFAAPGNPWIGTSTTPEGPQQVRAWIDFDSIPEHVGALSGGERRFLLLAASFGGGEPVILSDVLSGLDRDNLELVLAAVSHAGGSHEHSGMTFDETGTPKAFTHLTTLYPWPKGNEA
ncbi:ATP-binding cassette domain-containing protein [Arthrobacter bambusae]